VHGREAILLEPGPEIAMMLLMPDDTRSSVKSLPKEKFKVLAEANGWSLEHARGYVDGQAFRLRGKQPSQYALVGIDEYCLGFRAGYYERRDSDLTTDLSAPQ
jgi:hypothetical protein